jgi:hypothetical protein
VVRMDVRPMRCAKALSAVGGGGCKEAHVSGDKSVVLVEVLVFCLSGKAFFMNSFGGNSGRCAALMDTVCF